MKTLASDFCTLFNVLWYRDFPLAHSVKELGRRSEWTTHIAICVRSAADLLGYFTHFEEEKVDAVIKDESWPRKFRHPDKWKLCFITAGREPEKAARP
jgi:hypothetical protein